MELVLRGRAITAKDIELVRTLIKNHPNGGRSFLSRELCRQWGWTQNNGNLKDAACRAVLLGLEDRGLVELPARKAGTVRGRSQRHDARQLSFPILSAPQAQEDFPKKIDWHCALKGSGFSLYKELMDNHHYLGYRRAVGHPMRYIAQGEDRPIAAMGWAAAAQKVAAREKFIGWSRQQCLKNLHLVANNTRFLVIPRIPHLASHLLAHNIRRLANDWQARYGYAPVLLETFVDTTRFKGTCYKAANWIFAGLTKGRGKYDRYSRRPTTVKAVFLYPLRPDFREVLCDG